MEYLAVDDEKLARQRLVMEIQRVDPAGNVHDFSNADDALAYAGRGHIDVAFLDIEMRGKNGLMLAKELKNIDPKINVIFVTGYPQYALQSYRVHASGYVQKPITTEDVAFELQNLRNPIPIQEEEQTLVAAQCFGNFEVFYKGVPLHFERSKTKELLAYLVDRRGATVSTAALCAVLWEDSDDEKKAASYCRNLIADLAAALKNIGQSDLLVKGRGSYAIRPELLKCDYYDYLAGSPEGIRAFVGEYMTQYSWGEFTLGTLLEKE